MQAPLAVSPPGCAQFRSGGFAFIGGGALFLTYDLLEFVAGPPPPTGQEILSWVAANKLTLSLINEVLFFAAVSLLPASASLHRCLMARSEQVLASIGCRILFVVVPLLCVVLVIHGRLVYPVFGLHIRDPAVAEFAVALFFGGLHAADLLFAGAIFALSLVMRRGGFGAPIAALGFITTAGSIAAAYPWLIGPVALLACRLSFALWLGSVGVKLLARPDVDGRASPALRASH